ncbi:hypothetical protein A4G99_14525 [Haladaptatus sp. R4]|nr:hypothetical protein A4G99_14525 [Haladaptatus sp. R4]
MIVYLRQSSFDILFELCQWLSVDMWILSEAFQIRPDVEQSACSFFRFLFCRSIQPPFHVIN